MDERAGGELHRGFLPPEPGGPEPDLSRADGPPREAPDQRGFLPPEGAGAHGYAAPPQLAQPPPGQPQPARSTQTATEPDNGDAIAGVILSVSAATLLVLSVGASSIISVVCAALGIYYSRKGRARVDRGETPRHRRMAQTGFVTGIVALVLSILMTIFWTAFAIIYATDEDFREELKDELDEDEGPPDGFETAIPLGLVAVRAAALLLR